MRLKLLMFIFGFIRFTVSAQVVSFTIDSLYSRYSFLQPDSSLILNDSAGLYRFYEKLKMLKNGSVKKINVVHIGDSHIQADNYSGVVRRHFQIDFGNAGRGLIFPYRLARSNEPSDYRTSSDVKWEYKRNARPDKNIPIGISGYTIQTFDTAASVKVVLKNQGELNYSANKIKLFHSKDSSQFDFSIYDSLNREIAYVSNFNTKSKFVSDIDLPAYYSNITIKPCPRNTSQSCARLYGMLFENGNNGILYHMIGVNGAEYRHYIKSEYFTEQIQELNPDLIIISLGTNEAFNYRIFNRDVFYGQIDSLVKSLRQKSPGAEILLTTPGDSYKRVSKKGRVKNPTVKTVRETIIKYALENKLAYWDWYSVSGGYGSMAKWYSAGMADAARIHYTRRGYEIQGEMFYRAFKNAFEKYLLR